MAFMADDITEVVTLSPPSPWRQGWASAGAIIATLLLVLLLVLATIANGNREEALAQERHTQNVVLASRIVDATIARAEATLGRFVLDEDRSTGALFSSEWRRAQRQIEGLRRLVDKPDQRRRVAELKALYDKRSEELRPAVTQTVAGEGSGGVDYFYQAGLTGTGQALRHKLEEIASSERRILAARIAETRYFDAEAERLTVWLGRLAVLIGIGAILLGFAAYRALSARLLAEAQAFDEADRAASLELAVTERTRELSEANSRLREEAAERAAAEAQLRQVQKLEAIGQLTGGIAHDFNNMLAVVVGGLELAQRKLHNRPEEVEAHLESAMEGATRAAALTRRLLAFARSETLTPEAVVPATLVEGMLDLLDRSIGELIQLETRLAPDSWQVWADPSQLENAILNLCVNARDAMKGSGRILIHVENIVLVEGQIAALSGGDYVRIIVSDSGSGIPPELLDRVIEPFFTTKPMGKGTGLGLSQIFGFARQSGGDVTLESEVGVGTTVAIYLPRSTVVAGAAAAQIIKSDEPLIPPETRILLVEDDVRVSRATTSALEELGCIVTASFAAAEALVRLERGEQFDLVLSDVMMPEMTGPEFIRQLNERHPGMRALFVSGFVGQSNTAADLGGVPLLAKPFTVLALADAVAAALAQDAIAPHPSATSEAAE
jgi:signal transduction histidine kinase/ActR/RegA family two-component response regulator